MTEKITKKIKTDEAMTAHLKEAAASVAPSESAFKSALDKIPEGTPSPYAPAKSGFFTGRKIGATVLALVVLIGGGALYAYQSGSAPEPTAPAIVAPDGVSALAPDDATLTTSPSDTSDAAIATDLSTIDAQMQALDADTAAASPAPDATPESSASGAAEQ